MQFLIVLEVDFSHGIIFGVNRNGEEVEARWTGIIDLNQGDVIEIDQNNRYVQHASLRMV